MQFFLGCDILWIENGGRKCVYESGVYDDNGRYGRTGRRVCAPRGEKRGKSHSDGQIRRQTAVDKGKSARGKRGNRRADFCLRFGRGIGAERHDERSRRKGGRSEGSSTSRVRTSKNLSKNIRRKKFLFNAASISRRLRRCADLPSAIGQKSWKSSIFPACRGFVPCPISPFTAPQKRL